MFLFLFFLKRYTTYMHHICTIEGSDKNENFNLGFLIKMIFRKLGSICQVHFASDIR